MELECAETSTPRAAKESQKLSEKGQEEFAEKSVNFMMAKDQGAAKGAPGQSLFGLTGTSEVKPNQAFLAGGCGPQGTAPSHELSRRQSFCSLPRPRGPSPRPRGSPPRLQDPPPRLQDPPPRPPGPPPRPPGPPPRPRGPLITKQIQDSFKVFLAQKRVMTSQQIRKDDRTTKQICKQMFDDESNANDAIRILADPMYSGNTDQVLGDAKEIKTDITSLTNIYKTPSTDMDLIPKLSRIFRWREQICIASREKHIAHEVKDRLMNKLDRFVASDQWKIPCRVMQYLYCFERNECVCQNLSSLTLEKTHISGSVREGTEKHLARHGSDVDFMFQLGPLTVLGETEPPPAAAAPTALVVRQQPAECPGFVWLRHLPRPGCRHQTPRLLSSRRVQHFMQRFQASARMYAPRVVVPYKSSIDCSEKAAVPLQLGDTAVDLVACVLCPSWPSAEYASRRRPSGWPGTERVARLCRTPVFLVTAKVPGSGHNEGTWRLSFSRQESAVIRSMTKVQRTCLTMLKHCTDVQSYLLKTALMWQCEARDRGLWTWPRMLESMVAVLDFLLEAIRARRLPCYFCAEIDLFSGRRDLFQLERDTERAWQQLEPVAAALAANLLRSEQRFLLRPLLAETADRLLELHGGPDVRELQWSDHFLELFRWETLPARCRRPDWFAQHGLDTDSSADEQDPGDGWLGGW